MTEATVAHTGPVFLRWVAPLIDALRAMGGEGRAGDVIGPPARRSTLHRRGIGNGSLPVAVRALPIRRAGRGSI